MLQNRRLRRGPIAANLGLEIPDHHIPLATAVLEKKLDAAILPTGREDLSLIPGDLSLTEKTLGQIVMPQFALTSAIESMKHKFDFLIIDTPPGINLITANAVMAADLVTIPCTADRESLDAAKRTIETIWAYLEHRPGIREEGFARIAISQFDHRDRVMNNWLAEQLETLRLPTFESRIPRSTAFKKARALGLTVFEYAEKRRAEKKRPGRGADEIALFVSELLAYVHERDHSHERRSAAKTKAPVTA